MGFYDFGLGVLLIFYFVDEKSQKMMRETCHITVRCSRSR